MNRPGGKRKHPVVHAGPTTATASAATVRVCLCVFVCVAVFSVLCGSLGFVLSHTFTPTMATFVHAGLVWLRVAFIAHAGADFT